MFCNEKVADKVSHSTNRKAPSWEFCIAEQHTIVQPGWGKKIDLLRCRFWV